jgi:hypothetical protein
VSAVKPLGHLLCDSCGVERDGAPDRADWTITVAGGALRETTCPACADDDGNRPSRVLDPVPGSASAEVNPNLGSTSEVNPNLGSTSEVNRKVRSTSSAGPYPQLGEGSVELEISDHCIERWRERVRPGLTLEQAEEDLARQLAAHGYWAQPDWLSEKELGGDTWLMVGDSIGFAVRGRSVVSCFTRGTFNPRGRRLATEANGWARRVRRARENPAKRKAQGRAAKRNRRRDRRSWREEA